MLAHENLHSSFVVQALHGPPSPELTMSMPLLLLPPLLPLPPPSSEPLSLPPLPLGAPVSPPLALALPEGTGLPASPEPFHGGALLQAMSRPTADRQPITVRFGCAIIATSSSISELLNLCPMLLSSEAILEAHVVEAHLCGAVGAHHS